MKTNLSQSERISANATAITPNSCLQDNLRSLRLTYLLENAVQAAEQAAEFLLGNAWDSEPDDDVRRPDSRFGE